MPGGKFDPELDIVNGRISPRGSLNAESDEEISRLYAWVIQMREDGSGAVCAAFQEGGALQGQDTWTTRADAIHEGVFSQGQAFAMAVSVSRVAGDAVHPGAWNLLGPPKDDSTRVYWWSETILLK